MKHKVIKEKYQEMSIDAGIPNLDNEAKDSNQADEEVDIAIHCIENLEDKILKILFSFYDLSEDDFIFHGVTGTNGKTTTAFMAHNIIRALKKPSVYIGTLGAMINDNFLETKCKTISNQGHLYVL